MLQGTKLRQYLRSMSRRGIAVEQVLAGSGVPASAAEAKGIALDLVQSQIVIRNMITLSGNEALGLELGSELTASDMGIVGQSMIAAPTFRHTIELWAAYSPSLFDSLIKISISEAQDLWCMYVTAELPSTPITSSLSGWSGTFPACAAELYSPLTKWPKNSSK